MLDALLLVDLINDFRHEDGEALLASFRRRQPSLRAELDRARGSMPVIYANDDWGRWDSNAPALVREAVENGLGGELVADVAPRPGDYFVLKPRYSAFDSTPLELLLRQLRAERLLLAGAATEMCVTQTAIAARELGFKVTVLADACACVDERQKRIALEYLSGVVGVRVRSASDPSERSDPGRAAASHVTRGEGPDGKPPTATHGEQERHAQEPASKRTADEPGCQAEL